MGGRRLLKEEALTGADAFKMDLYFWLQALARALVTLILLFTFVGRVIGVDGRSMLPTLHDRDTLILQSVGYRPAQGDIIVLTKYFEQIRGPIVKRVIATEGQRVDIDYTAGTVTVDGQVLDEPYIKEMMYPVWGENMFHAVVPAGHVFVMGDNRNQSNDSRNPALGTVDERYILGKALMVLMPLNHLRVMN